MGEKRVNLSKWLNLKSREHDDHFILSIRQNTRVLWILHILCMRRIRRSKAPSPTSRIHISLWASSGRIDRTNVGADWLAFLASSDRSFKACCTRSSRGQTSQKNSTKRCASNSLPCASCQLGFHYPERAQIEHRQGSVLSKVTRHCFQR